MAVASRHHRQREKRAGAEQIAADIAGPVERRIEEVAGDDLGRVNAGGDHHAKRGGRRSDVGRSVMPACEHAGYLLLLIEQVFGLGEFPERFDFVG